MKILFYYDRAFLPNDGGIAMISLSLIKCLEDAGYKVFDLAKNNMNRGEYLKYQFYLPSEDIISDINISYVQELLESQKIDVVINQQPIDDEAEELWIRVRNQTGIRVISCLHNPITLSAKNFVLTKEYYLKKMGLGILAYVLKSELVKKVLLQAYLLRNRTRYKKIVENSDNVVVLCDGMKSELTEMIGHDDSKISIIPNFIKSVPELKQVEEKEKLVVWCGRVNFSVKRIDVMLSLWQKVQNQYPDWKLCILGDGPDLTEAKQLAKQLSLNNVSFEGRVNPYDYYKKAKYVVVTSSYESFSLVTLEAMAHSALPIGFNTFPAASMLLGSNLSELFVPAYHYDELCLKIEQLENASNYIRIQKDIHSRAVKFSEAVVANEWISLLSKNN